MARTDLLDCSKIPTAAFWAVIGVLLAGLVHLLQAPPNAASLLRVGTANPLFRSIERDIGPIVSAGLIGHDGQIFYMIARDPFAKGDTAQALASFDQNPPRYRYRRILLPLLAGGAGRFSPKTTVISLILWTVAGLALTAIGVADIAFSLRLPVPVALASIVNLGALVSVMLVTADVLALGLALIGVALFVRGHFNAACLLLALATLAKETYWLVPLALAASLGFGQIGRAAALLAATAVPLGCWSLWLAFSVPYRSGVVTNLGAPFAGVAASASDWMGTGLDPVQGVFAFFVGLSVLLAIIGAAVGRSLMLRWVALGWVILASLGGLSVWIIPTNAARAFAMLWPLGVLLTLERVVPATPRHCATE